MPRCGRWGRTRAHDSRRRSLSCDPSQENQDGNPQTPDSMKKSQQEKAPARTPREQDAGTLSNPGEGDRSQKRQGGH